MEHIQAAIFCSSYLTSVPLNVETQLRLKCSVYKVVFTQVEIQTFSMLWWTSHQAEGLFLESRECITVQLLLLSCKLSEHSLWGGEWSVCEALYLWHFSGCPCWESLGMRLRCSCCFVLSEYRASQKSWNNRPMSGCILKLHPPTHLDTVCIVFVCVSTHLRSHASPFVCLQVRAFRL